jgi:hypothetical protein
MINLNIITLTKCSRYTIKLQANNLTDKTQEFSVVYIFKRKRTINTIISPPVLNETTTRKRGRCFKKKEAFTVVDNVSKFCHYFSDTRIYSPLHDILYIHDIINRKCNIAFDLVQKQIKHIFAAVQSFPTQSALS